MKTKIVLGLLTLSAASFSQAKPCENFAKFEAIKSYKESTGVIQGSYGIQYSSVLKTVVGKTYTYDIAISDNNDEGEGWTTYYVVSMKKEKNKCVAVSVVNIDSESDQTE